MTNDEMRVKIAEALGWTKIQHVSIAAYDATGAKMEPEPTNLSSTAWTALKGKTIPCEFVGLRLEDGDQLFGLPKGYTGDARLRVPDYLSDLNAMHEAEAWLIAELGGLHVYLNHLYEIVGNCQEDVIHATARQRAEAFLKTINAEPTNQHD